jgi:hypothetical protein
LLGGFKKTEISTAAPSEMDTNGRWNFLSVLFHRICYFILHNNPYTKLNIKIKAKLINCHWDLNGNTLHTKLFTTRMALDPETEVCVLKI